MTPETFIGWHRRDFQLFWRWKCQSGGPRIPEYLQHLIRKLARKNLIRGRSASEFARPPAFSTPPDFW